MPHDETIFESASFTSGSQYYGELQGAEGNGGEADNAAPTLLRAPCAERACRTRRVSAASKDTLLFVCACMQAGNRRREACRCRCSLWRRAEMEIEQHSAQKRTPRSEQRAAGLFAPHAHTPCAHRNQPAHSHTQHPCQTTTTKQQTGRRASTTGSCATSSAPPTASTVRGRPLALVAPSLLPPSRRLVVAARAACTHCAL